MQPRQAARNAHAATLQPAAANNTIAPRKQVATRMLNGGTSSSAILLAGQVTPQATLSATSMSRAVASDSG